MMDAPGDADALAGILDEIAGDPDRLDDYRQRTGRRARAAVVEPGKQKYVTMLQPLAGGQVMLHGTSNAGGSAR